MSDESIARWNSIPLIRESTEQASLKRSREDSDDDEDMSIVSRTPSPTSMDVDAQNIDTYDEYARGIVTEAITVDTRISNSNKGYAMLARLGWSEGQPLGFSGEGRVDPVPFYVKRDLTGLGKDRQDTQMIETTVSQRRELDSERQRKETEQQRLERENAVARNASIRSEVSETLKAFYCSVCEKQFTKVAQYDEHCNSYSHHHKIRFREMQAAQRGQNNSQEAVEKRREKERKREEKELKKAAKAAGVKIATSTPVVQPVLIAQASTSTTQTDAEDVQPTSVFKSNVWAPATSGGFKKAGWKTIASQEGSVPPPPSERSPSPSPLIPQVPPAPEALNSFSGFRSGGWTSLESSLSEKESQPLQDSTASHSGWTVVPPISNQTSSAQSARPSPGAWLSSPSSQQPDILSSDPAALPPNITPLAPPAAEVVRSGWQQFKRGGKGSRR